MGRVARLILLVVVSVCVVFCVLCCLQNNLVFLSVTYLIFHKMKIMSYVFWRVSSLRPEKKVLVVCLVGTRSLLRPEKKSSSPLSGGCAIVITTGKKKFQSSVWRVRDRYNDRKKKSSSRLSGGCAIIITTGKKSSSRLSGGCAIKK